MKLHLDSILRIAATLAMLAGSVHAADVTLSTGTYTDTQTYDNGTLGPGNANLVTFNSGANYTFTGSLSLPLAWNHITLNSGASLSVAGNLSVDVSGVSLNGGTLTTGGLLLHDSPNWNGSINDGKQTIEYGDSIINGSTIIANLGANPSNANFISLAGGTGAANGWVANNLWLGNDGATINSNGNDIGITMVMGNFSGQAGKLTKTGSGTLTLSAINTYTGGTTVDGGTLSLDGTSGNGRIAGALTVNVNGTVVTTGDGTGLGFNDQITQLTVNGGTVKTFSSTGGHIWNITSGVSMTGGELQTNGGVSTTTGDAFQWNRTALTTNASANTAVISGRVNLRGDIGYTNWAVSVADGLAATDLLVSAAITGTGVNITKSGAGTMTLTGANTFNGATVVDGGTLILGSNANPEFGALENSSLLTINNSGTKVQATGANAFKGYSGGNMDVTINGGELTINDGVAEGGNHNLGAVTLNGGTISGVGGGTYGGFNLNGTVTVTENSTISATNTNTNGGNRTVAVSANKTLDWTGTIHNGPGTTSLTFDGPGTTILSNTNTYSGATTVSGGTLKVTGSIATSDVAVNGGILASGSTGTVGKIVTVNSGATFAAGDVETVGTASVASDLNFSSGSIFDWDLSTGPGIGTYDTVAVTGALNITSGAKFNVVSSTAFTDTFWDATHTWTDIFGSKTFDNFLVSNFLYSGSATAPAAEGSFTITGSSLTWTAVPEPTSALAGLLLTAGLLRRRRA